MNKKQTELVQPSGTGCSNLFMWSVRIMRISVWLATGSTIFQIMWLVRSTWTASKNVRVLTEHSHGIAPCSIQLVAFTFQHISSSLQPTVNSSAPSLAQLPLRWATKDVILHLKR